MCYVLPGYISSIISLLVENTLYLFSVAALWFITLQVYYTHRAALLIDQDFQPAVGSFSNFIRLDCNRPVALCV